MKLNWIGTWNFFKIWNKLIKFITNVIFIFINNKFTKMTKFWIEINCLKYFLNFFADKLLITM